MKRTIMALLMCLTISAASAHLEDGCTVNGNHSIHIINAAGFTITMKIDGIVKPPVVVTSQDQVYYIPQPVNVAHNVESVIGSTLFTLHTGINVCATLALVNESAYYNYNKPRDSIRVSVTFTDEALVNTVRLVHRSPFIIYGITQPATTYGVQSVTAGRKQYLFTISNTQ